MKKTLLGLFLVLGMASFANNKIELKGAYDLGGEYRFMILYQFMQLQNILLIQQLL